AYHATNEGFLVVPGIAETQFPIPILEVIAKLAHLTAKSGIKQHVVERGLGCSAACVSNTTEMNSGGDRRAIGQSYWFTLVVNRSFGKRVKRICDWHTDAVRAKGITVRFLEWIRGKPSSRPGSIKN